MGYVDFLATEFTSEPSPRETARFGYPTDRLTIGLRRKLPGILAARLVAESTAKIKILRYPSEDLSLFRLLASSDFRCYPGGSLIYWEHTELLPARLNVEAVTDVHCAADRDGWSANVMDVIRDSFAGYINHYAANPLIPEAVAAAGYMEWAASTIQNPDNLVVSVSSDEGATVGAAVISVQEGVWEVELASVVTAAQRRGHYTTLVERILSEAGARGARSVVISTQSHNIAVQRAWTKLGFAPVLSIDTVHIVNEDAVVDRGDLAQN